MPASDYGFVPVLHDGILVTGAPGLVPELEMAAGPAPQASPVGQTGQILLDPRPEADFVLHCRRDGADLPGSPLAVQVGGWTGRVDWVRGGLLGGRARNNRHPGRDVAVVAFTPAGVVAVAVARAAEGGRFLMVLPPQITGAAAPVVASLGIAGSDYLLEGGRLRFGPEALRPAPGLIPRPLQDLAIRIKISCPNLKEAPMWGDYHFANSLAAGFERLGHQASVDTADVWYAQKAQEDVVIAIRGRHRVKTDPGRVNIMWIISHPDRIPDEEFADYDHVAVASDIYAAELRARGLPSVSVLHQATDSTLFRHDPDRTRRAACLFVGNSRKEYRTMVKWCLQKEIPLELYGGGWEGVLPEGMLRGTSVANADLPEFYGSHLMLLNDHWESMRDNGFLSNRLFDGSGTATPILTDPVAGLADVFGDTISEAGEIEGFAALVQDCLNDPAPYLDRAARAHDIVMAAHTFDHRAAELSDRIDRIAAAKRRLA
jgi:hypothetical protein